VAKIEILAYRRHHEINPRKAAAKWRKAAEKQHPAIGGEEAENSAKNAQSAKEAAAGVGSEKLAKYLFA